MEKEVRQMSIKEMWNYLIFQTKGYRQLGAAIVAGAVCGAGISYINSILYARIIDTLLLEQYTTAVHYVWIMILAVLVVRLVYIMCNQIFEQYASPSRDETKRRTAEKAFSMEFEEIEKEENQIAFRRTRGGVNGAGDIEAQLDSIYKFFTECVKILFALVFLLILIVQSAQGAHVAAWKIFLMTALLAGMFVFSFWVNVRVSDRIGKKQVELNHENERINFLYGYLFKIFTSETAAKDIRLYGMQDYLCGKNETCINASSYFSEEGIYEGKNQAKFSFVVQLLAGYIYVYVAVMAMSGVVSVGDVLMYSGAIITMMTGVQNILMQYNQINYRNEYLKTYEDFIKRPNMHYDGTLPIEKRDDNEYELSFRNVSFRYPGTADDILKNVSLDFKIGQKMALVGMNGAGKTTLIKLLLRLYEPTEGEICLNGINIEKYDYEEYLQIFSVVFQDFKLFAFPLDENIAAGGQVDKRRLKQVLTKIGLNEFVEGLPKKECTLLYQENGGGVTPSGGEAQKVAIARALYKDAPFVILDEPTAALDPIAEAGIYENFDSLVGEKTAVYISHRMSSCKFCDRIVVLDQGEIVEEGTHEQLLEQNGIYAKLYQTQAEYYVTAQAGT